MLNLSKTNVAQLEEAGYEFELIVPDTVEGTGAFIKVRGKDSKIARQHSRKMFQEAQMKEQKARRQGKDAPQPTLEEIEESINKTAYLRIISWRGMSEDGKTELPFNEENALRILNEHDWIRTAVLENSNDGSKFRFD